MESRQSPGLLDSAVSTVHASTALNSNPVLRTAKGLLAGPFYAAWCGYYKLFKTGRRFTVFGKEYPYFYHTYNLTWRCERSVEVPFAWAQVQEATAAGKRVLELGNVLAHYFSTSHDVVDTYEKGTGVINADVMEFSPKHGYDLIVSVSTLEHVGFDESVKEPLKGAKAIGRLKGFLNPGGRLIVTFPLGWNKTLDEEAITGRLGFTKQVFLKRTSADNDWEQTTAAEAAKIAYGKPFPGANALFIGEYEK